MISAVRPTSHLDDAPNLARPSLGYLSRFEIPLAVGTILFLLCSDAKLSTYIEEIWDDSRFSDHNASVTRWPPKSELNGIFFLRRYQDL